MFRKICFAFCLVIVLFSASATVSVAQSAPVRGKVELKKADGTTIPLADALIEVYRTDIEAKLPSGKTNKKGEFSFAGFPVAGIYVLSVSAPNINPQVSPQIRAGVENIIISVVEGSGKRLTEEEVRQPSKTVEVNDTRQSSAAVTTVSKKTELSAKDKKAQEEYQKIVAETESKNKNIESINVIINRSLKEGDKEFKNKNYDAAIALFEEGINADPDFAGTAVVLLNNKALVLINRAISLNNQNVKADATVKAEAMVKVRKDYEDAIFASERALLLLKNSTEADPNIQKGFAVAKRDALINLKEAHRLMIKSGADRTKDQAAILAFQEYIAAETDSAMKIKAQIQLGDIMREAGNVEESIKAYRLALQSSPDHPDVLAGLGLSLFNAGVVSNNTAQKQEGLNFMQKFADVAPETHPLKTSVRDAVEYLKTQDKLTPQKTGKRKS